MITGAAVFSAVVLQLGGACPERGAPNGATSRRAAVALLLQAAPTQSETERVEAALRKFGDRTYTAVDTFMESKRTSTVEFRTRIEKDGDRTVVVFDDRFITKTGEKETIDSRSERASLPGLKLISMTEEAPGRPKRIVTIQDGRAKVTRGDDRVEFDVTPSTMGILSLTRALSIREQKIGDKFTLDLVRGQELDRGHVLECEAKETIEIGGAKVEAFRWKQTWESKDDITDEVIKHTQSYWISPEGFLLRLVTEYFEMTLKSK